MPSRMTTTGSDFRQATKQIVLNVISLSPSAGISPNLSRASSHQSSLNGNANGENVCTQTRSIYLFGFAMNFSAVSECFWVPDEVRVVIVDISNLLLVFLWLLKQSD